MKVSRIDYLATRDVCHFFIDQTNSQDIQPSKLSVPKSKRYPSKSQLTGQLPPGGHLALQNT